MSLQYSRFLSTLTYALMVIGALNWGLIGLFNYDLVGAMLGYSSFASNVVYFTVGLSAIINLIMELTVCKDPARCYISH